MQKVVRICSKNKIIPCIILSISLLQIEELTQVLSFGVTKFQIIMHKAIAWMILRIRESRGVVKMCQLWTIQGVVILLRATHDYHVR